MARARNIKPSFFANEELAELPFETRLCFIGLWCLADREGRLEDRPKRIKMELFAADSVDVDAMLDQLVSAGFVARYAVDGVRVVQILTFAKHQKPHAKEQPSTLPPPPPPGSQTVTAEKPLPRSLHTTTKEESSTDLGNGEHALNPSSLIADCGLLEKTKAARERAGAEPAPVIPEWLPASDWQAFAEHRRRLRAPMTARAMTMAIEKLAELRATGADPSAVIRSSIVNGWKGLFPLKGDPPSGRAPPAGSVQAERGRVAAEIWRPIDERKRADEQRQERDITDDAQRVA